MALSVLLLLFQSIRAQETFGTVVGAVAAVAAKVGKVSHNPNCSTNSASCQSVLIEFAPIGTAVI